MAAFGDFTDIYERDEWYDEMGSADDDANLCKSVGGGGWAPPSLDIDHATRLGVSQPPSLDTPTTPWTKEGTKKHAIRIEGTKHIGLCHSPPAPGIRTTFVEIPRNGILLKHILELRTVDPKANRDLKMLSQCILPFFFKLT